MGVTILTECEAVPFCACQKAIRCMQYASKERVMFEMLVLTGCRLQALDNMRIGMLINGEVFYHPGKNQKRYLKSELPAWYLKELSEYRKSGRVWGDHLFSCTADSFRRYFVEVRKRLTPEWRELVLMPRQGRLCDTYRLQLKGIRKMFWTAEFRRQLEKWKSSEVALEMVSKLAAHSTNHMTAYHYIRDFSQIGDIKGSIAENIHKGQTSLMEY